MVVMERELVVPKGMELIAVSPAAYFALLYHPLYDRWSLVIKDYLSYPLPLGKANGVAASTGAPHIKAGQCAVQALWVVEVRVYVNLIRAAHLPVHLAYQGLYVPPPPVACRVPLHVIRAFGYRRLGVESRWDQ